MPANKTLGKLVTDFLITLAEINDYSTYDNIVETFFTKRFHKSSDDLSKKERNRLKNRFIKAYGQIKEIQAETGRLYLEPVEEGDVIFKLHDDAPTHKRTCIILLEVRKMLRNDEVIKGVFENYVFEKYKRISGIENALKEWTKEVVEEKMKKACEKGFLILKDNKYTTGKRFTCDLEVIKGIVRNYRDRVTDEEIKAQLTDLLEHV